MNITQHQAQMIGFARAVLTIMETESAWSADTLQEIAVLAERFELADSDNEGDFRVIA